MALQDAKEIIVEECSALEDDSRFLVKFVRISSLRFNQTNDSYRVVVAEEDG